MGSNIETILKEVLADINVELNGSVILRLKNRKILEFHKSPTSKELIIDDVTDGG